MAGNKTISLFLCGSLALGGLSLGLTTSAFAADNPVLSTTFLDAQVSDATRYTFIEDSTNVGFIYRTSIGGNTRGTKLYYKRYDTAQPVLIYSYPDVDKIPTKLGEKATLVNVGGVDKIIYLDKTPGSEPTIYVKTLTLVSGNINVATTIAIKNPSDEYVGSTGTEILYLRDTIIDSKIRRVLYASQMNGTGERKIATFGESVQNIQADTQNILVAYKDQTLYNGSPGRIAYLPIGSADIPLNTNIVDKYERLGAISLDPAGGIWAFEPSDSTGPRLSVYRRTDQVLKTYSGLYTDLGMVEAVGVVPSPDGTPWGVWNDVSDSAGGVSKHYRGQLKAIKASLVGSSARATLHDVSSGAISTTPGGRLIAYDVSNLAAPTIQGLDVSNTGTVVKTTLQNIEYRPATVLGLGITKDRLYQLDSFDEGGQRRLRGRNGVENSATTYPDVYPSFSSTHIDLKGNLQVSPKGNVAVAGTRKVGDVETFGLIVSTKDYTKFKDVAALQPFLRGLSETHAVWRDLGDDAKAGKQHDFASGKTETSATNIIAEAANGGVMYQSQSGSGGIVERVSLLSGQKTELLVDTDCTVIPREVWKNWMLYDCSGTPKLARINWSGSGWVSDNLTLSASRTWHLGDGFLAWRTGTPKVDSSYTFGISTVSGSTLTDTTLETVNIYDYEKEPPQFDTDTTGGHRMVYANGDADLKVLTLDLPPVNDSAPASVSAPASFSPDGNGDQDFWNLSGTYQQQVEWSLVILDANSNQVAKWTSSSPTTNAGVSWDGAGAENGNYTWVLSAVPVDGSEVTQQSGTVTLARPVKEIDIPAAPPVEEPGNTQPDVPNDGGENPVAATLSAPSIGFSPTGMIVASWSGRLTASANGWQIYQSTTTTNKAGKKVSTEWKSVGPQTKAESSSMILPELPNGGLVRYKLATVVNETPAVWSNEATTLVPIDDTVFSGTGWNKIINKKAHAGKVLSTKVAGEKATATLGKLGTATLYGWKTPKGGKAVISVNGKTVKTVPMNGASKRVSLWSGKLTKKTNKIVVSSKKGTKGATVILDAVVVK